MTTANLFKRFKDLMPEPPLLVGQVISVGGGIATIEEPGGGLNQARGAATVGQRVFFRDGVIEGVAPSLPLAEIEV
jgi:hypothetical protein